VTQISLVVSDVDGTLVTPDKQLSEATIVAVRQLHERGINFTLVSSRPPIGLRMLVAPLTLRLPMGAFTGGLIVSPALEVLEQHLVPEAAARRTFEMMTACGADVWLFTADAWLVRNPSGDYVPREKQTLRAEPTVVADFGPYFPRISKVVGSSKDFARLIACETALREALRGAASIARSQQYYLDVTPPGLDKGTFVAAIAKRLGIARAAIAVLGDMENDLAMFRQAGLSIAMGNASIDIKRRADFITASNGEDGFALAITRYVLQDPRAAARA
jgi:Cof subfamily protein (haloacid dehalogenase superfamily)